MEQYLRRGKTAGALDDLGLRALIFLLAGGWFIYLWGLGMPALLAGLALGLMGQMALTRYRRRTVGKREQALRRRLGGEMLMERLMLSSPRKAHFQAAILLGQRYPLVLERVTEEGMLCRLHDELLLIVCLRKAADSAVSAEDVLSAQRGCLKHKADRCVLCLTGKSSAAVEAFAEKGSVPVRLIPRETMLTLAGQASPATDEQLLSLKARRQRGKGSLRRAVLRSGKSGRYLFYGIAMLIVHILTGWRWYILPGIILVVLAVWSRWEGEAGDEL